jgi:hypothetical protein
MCPADLKNLKVIIEQLVRDEITKLAPSEKGHAVNIPTNKHKAKEVAPDVADMVNSTYASMGGYPGADSPDGVLNRFTDFFLADVDDDPEPDAGILYTNWGGSKKASAFVTDGGTEAKSKLRDMMKDFLSRPGSWTEVSGAPANILVSKMNMPTVDDEAVARKLLSQIKDLRWHGKHPAGIPYGNGWYTRSIAGKDETKIIVGKP